MKRPCIDGVYFTSNTVGIHLDQLPEVRSAYTSRRPDFTSSYPGLQYVRTPYIPTGDSTQAGWSLSWDPQTCFKTSARQEGLDGASDSRRNRSGLSISPSRSVISIVSPALNRLARHGPPPSRYSYPGRGYDSSALLLHLGANLARHGSTIIFPISDFFSISYPSHNYIHHHGDI